MLYMEKKYILSIDSGGTGIRAILFNRSGEIVEKEYEKTLPSTPVSGAIEHDPEVLWDALKSVVDKVFAKSEYSAEEVAAIGITNQRASFCLWERETGKPVSPLISWADVRCADMVEKMNKDFKYRAFRTFTKLISKLTNNVMLNVAGMLKLTSSHAVVRLYWLFKEKPELLKRAEKGELMFGTLDTWFIYKLTAHKKHLTDVTNAAATSMYNHFQFEWNSIICSIFKIPMNIFPEVKENIDDFGMTEKSLWGVKIPIKAVAGDQMASLFGHCSFEKGSAKISQGSGAFVDINVGEKPKLSKRGLFPLLAWKINGKTTYMLEGIVATAGTLIDWLGKGMGLADTPKVLNEFASQTEDTNGVIFIPTPSGINFPYFDARMRASVFGLSLSTHRRHLARAVLEGIAMRDVEIMLGIEQDTDIDIKSIRVDGGVSKSDILLQILSDLADVRVERAPESDMTATGVGYLAGIGAGFWQQKDLTNFCSNYDVFEPKIDEETRKTKIERWKKAVKAARLVK